MCRTLIAGFGNVLRGDDGFGVEVIRRLEEAEPSRNGVRLLEVGTGGLGLAQELLAGYDRLIVVDAMTRGGPPGTVYVLEVEDVEPAVSIDLHLAIPARALAVARALGVLPPRIHLVACEPAEVDELAIGLTAVVERAVPVAVRHVARLAELEPMRSEVS
ncbi:MAG: hydrogenase maturation protease [Gemmatimonadales bacterium]|nr:hydrogenase maturation protease [Gemmatimonadales bacterium]